MPSAKIANLNSQDMIKLRNNLSYIPIHATEIRESLDSYKEMLNYKSNFINEHHYNTSLSPEVIEKKSQISSQARHWQHDLTSIFKTKITKKAARLMESVKEKGEIEANAFDSIILRNIIQKMKIDEMTRRISLETYRAKLQNFNIDRLKKKAGREMVMKKFKEKEKNSIWNKVQMYRKPTIEPHVPNRAIKNPSDFDFITEIEGEKYKND